MYPDDRRSFVLPTAEGEREKLTRDMLVAHYQRIYRPEGGRITVLGDIGAREITPKLEALLADWKGAGTKPAEAPAPPCQQGPHGHPRGPAELGADRVLPRQPCVRSPQPRLHPRPGAEPRAGRGPRVPPVPEHPRGEGAHLRHRQWLRGQPLFEPLRVADVGAHRGDRGALRELLKEFADIRNRLVPADELENAKRALVASFALSTENQATALSNATRSRTTAFQPITGIPIRRRSRRYRRGRAARLSEICAAR